MNPEVMIIVPNIGRGDEQEEVFHGNLESFPSIDRDSPWIVLSISKGFWYTSKDKASHRIDAGDTVYIHSVSGMIMIKKG